MSLDMVIRGGTIVDGTGNEPFECDVAICDGRISAVGQLDERGAQEIDARGLLVITGALPARLIRGPQPPIQKAVPTYA